MYQYPQLYADVSTITWVIPRTAFYDYLEALIRAGLGKRLMFGSDQMVWPEKISTAIEAIKQAPFLTKQQKRDILYNNAAAFLRLEKAEDVSIQHKMEWNNWFFPSLIYRTSYFRLSYILSSLYRSTEFRLIRCYWLRISGFLFSSTGWHGRKKKSMRSTMPNMVYK